MYCLAYDKVPTWTWTKTLVKSQLTTEDSQVNTILNRKVHQRRNKNMT
jgi:hypothetical protein